jgi:serine/threonine protein kinase
MAVLCQPGGEPIPGYQLVQRLGTGGYGEVWKATAPGELTKAIKIVYGHRRDARAEQELKSLGRIKEVRHPFILSLERFEIIENQLVIVMELADGSLMDRFQECQQSGLPGIPRPELLGHLLDAAEALDYMGEQYGLQHLDIKPQNLLLVGGRIKLADFGLVKDLEGSSASATGGITPIYATPEAFDGRVSRFSDQYSLAIVYQEMLTGCRPFPGTTALQLAAQHGKCPPLLDSLTAQDRPIIRRALSKIPEQRFPTCQELVQSLLAAGEPLSRSTGSKAAIRSPLRAEQSSRVIRRTATPAARVGHVSNVLPQPEHSPREVAAPRAREVSTPVLRPQKDANQASPVRGALVSPTAGGPGLRPTLFLGVGGIAGWTLGRLRQRLQRRFGDLATVPILRLLLLDTDRTAFLPAEPQESGAARDATETLLLPLRRPEHYRAQARELLRWIDRRWLYNIPRSLLTEGARPLGHLALIDHAAEVLSRLRETISALTSASAKAASVQATGLQLRGEDPQVFVVASIAGGTGGGMVLALAYAMQQVLAELDLPSDRLRGILVLATGSRQSEAELARLNAYATLSELQYFSSPGAVYPGDPEHELLACGPGVSPFRDTYIVHLGDQLDRTSVEAATDSLADYLSLCAASGVGAFLDEWREQTHAATYGSENCRLRLFCLHRLSFPKLPLAARAADLFCKQLVDRWCGQAGGREEERAEQEARVQIPLLGLDLESLANQFHAAALRVFGEEPEQCFLKMLADFPPERMPSPTQPLTPEFTKETLTKIDIFLGPSADPRGGNRPVQTPVDVELSKQAELLTRERSRWIIDWFLTLVETPDRRLKAAHSAAQASRRYVAEASSRLQEQLTQLQSQRALLRSRYAAGDFGSPGSGSAWLGNRRRLSAESSPRQKLIDYCSLRLHEIVLENVVGVFDGVAGQIADFLPKLEHGSETLRHFSAGLASPTVPTQGIAEAPLSLPNLTEFLPDGCKSLAEGAQRLLRRLEPGLSQSFENALQAEVLSPRGGLWGIASGKAEGVQPVQTELRRRALAHLIQATRDLDAAKLFLEHLPEHDDALRELLAYLASVLPNPEVPKGWQHLVVALPDSSAGATLRELLAPALAELPSTVLDSEGDIVLCHEAADLPLPQMATILIGDEAPYAEAARHVLTRTDIPWSPLSLGKTARMG